MFILSANLIMTRYLRTVEVILRHLSLGQVVGGFICPPLILLVPYKRIICFFFSNPVFSTIRGPGLRQMGHHVWDLQSSNLDLQTEWIKISQTGNWWTNHLKKFAGDIRTFIIMAMWYFQPNYRIKYPVRLTVSIDPARSKVKVIQSKKDSWSWKKHSYHFY